jgi:AbrB family looped-hinge helix DNA binding protein
MEAAVIKVSSKGQIVIPSSMRKRLKIEEGEEILVVSEGDVIMLKKVVESSIDKEFNETITPLRQKIKKLGLTRSDLEDSIQVVRRNGEGGD